MVHRNEERNENQQHPAPAKGCRQSRGRRTRPENQLLSIQEPSTPPQPSLQAGGNGYLPNGLTMNLPLRLDGPLPRMDHTTPCIAEVTKPDADTARGTDPGATTETGPPSSTGGMTGTKTALHGFSRNAFDTSRTSAGLTLRNTNPEMSLG